MSRVDFWSLDISWYTEIALVKYFFKTTPGWGSVRDSGENVWKYLNLKLALGQLQAGDFQTLKEVQHSYIHKVKANVHHVKQSLKDIFLETESVLLTATVWVLIRFFRTSRFNKVSVPYSDPANGEF
jgi:hypothetical protein